MSEQQQLYKWYLRGLFGKTKKEGFFRAKSLRAAKRKATELSETGSWRKKWLEDMGGYVKYDGDSRSADNTWSRPPGLKPVEWMLVLREAEESELLITEVGDASSKV